MSQTVLVRQTVIKYVRIYIVTISVSMKTTWYAQHKILLCRFVIQHLERKTSASTFMQ